MQLLFLRQWFSDDILQAIGWTLIHSLWQGLLAAAVAAIIIISTRKTAARVRYNLLGIVLVLFLVTTFITFGKQLHIAAITGSTDPSSPVVAAGEVFFDTETTATVSPAATSFTDTFINWFNRHADIFVLGWTLFFLMNCLKLFTGIASVHRLRHYRTHPVTEEWKEKAAQLSMLLGIRRSVILLQSELVKVPIALGYLKPMILVPVGLITHLPPAQVETILLHELAHIRRRDYLVNLIQRFAEAIFFFNPALLWISSLLRQEREACCDDMVIAHTDHKRQYLDALVAFQEYSLSRSYAMAISSRRDYLLSRVKRMLTRENKKLGWLEQLALVAGLLLFSAFTYLSREEEKDLTKKADKIEMSERPRFYSLPEQAVPLLKITTPVKLAAGIRSIPQDTVPPRREMIRKLLESRFKKVESATTNKNGDETMIITVTGSDDKKYIIHKDNGRITSLNADGRQIPVEEMPEWMPLFERLNMMNKTMEAEQKEKYREQVTYNDKGTENARKQALLDIEMKKLENRKNEIDRNNDEKLKKLKQEFTDNSNKDNKARKQFDDSIKAWGKQLQQEMNELTEDMKKLQNLDQEIKNEKNERRIGEQRNENDRKESPRIGNKPRVSNKVIGSKHDASVNVKNAAINSQQAVANHNGKNVLTIEKKWELNSERKYGIKNENANGNGSGSGNGNNDKNENKNDNKDDGRNEKRETAKELKSDINNNKKIDLKETFIDTRQNSRRIGSAGRKLFDTKSEIQLKGAHVLKANHDYENAIRMQLSENAHLAYNIDAGSNFQYKPMPVSPTAPKPPGAPQKKPDARKKKAIDTKSKSSLFELNRQGWTPELKSGWNLQNPRLT